MKEQIQTTIFVGDDTEVIVQGEMITDYEYHRGQRIYDVEKNWTEAFDSEMNEIELTDEIENEANKAEWEYASADEY